MFDVWIAFPSFPHPALRCKSDVIGRENETDSTTEERVADRRCGIHVCSFQLCRLMSERSIAMMDDGVCLSGSHVVVHLVRRYPEMRIICFDKLDYCSSLSNLKAVSGG